MYYYSWTGMAFTFLSLLIVIGYVAFLYTKMMSTSSDSYNTDYMLNRFDAPGDGNVKQLNVAEYNFLPSIGMTWLDTTNEAMDKFTNPKSTIDIFKDGSKSEAATKPLGDVIDINKLYNYFSIEIRLTKGPEFKRKHIAYKWRHCT